MRGTRAASIALWVLGIVLVTDSVLRGAARVSLVVIVPVISGQSAEFLLGIVFLLAGFLTVPWLLFEGVHVEAPSEELSTESPSSPPPSHGPVGGGGLLLIGPVPILFGGWRNVSRRTRWWLAVVGGVILVAFVAAAVLAFR